MPNESFEGNIVNGVFEAIEECLKQGNVLKLGFWSGDGAKMVRGWPTHGRMAALEIPDTEKALGCAYRSSIPEAIKAVAGQYVWGRTHKRNMFIAPAHIPNVEGEGSPDLADHVEKWLAKGNRVTCKFEDGKFVMDIKGKNRTYSLSGPSFSNVYTALYH